MYDVANKTTSWNICTLFHYTKEIHSYNTRSSLRNDFFVKRSRLNIQKNSFSRMGALVWNQIPAHIRDMHRNSFKSEIKSLLFKRLAVNGYYAENKLYLQLIVLKQSYYLSKAFKSN